MRQLRLRMSDETVRSVMVDENQPVANLMVIVCTKLGITNHDEYSLIATGKHTINGRRRERLDGRVIDQKMEQLKKKLKTDEDLAWVDHSKTLDEQEIHEQDIVLLRRRFFYSDHNVDKRDPLQLGLLYVQTRDAILSGTHPVTLDGACRFAGIQCQAQLGDFSEARAARPFNVRDYLPADYAKTKQVERKIFAEHKKYFGLSELEAQARYVQEARALPTYGVTFFLVKEKVPGKSKLVPRLLGITKDCVMRVDADTKAILKTWPLTTVKRSAASMNSFTFDFGDYSDSYYSVQTSEGEQISQLFAGYIDIILKRRKAKDHFGIEGDEGATMVEDSVAPSRATIIQNQPALARAYTPAEEQTVELLSSLAGPQVERTHLVSGPTVEPPEYRPAVEVRGRAEIGYEARPATQYVASYEPTPPQRELQDKLEQAREAVLEAERALERPQQQSKVSQQQTASGSSNSLEQSKRRLSSQFAEINAATAQLVSLSAIPEQELNYPALNRAVETVTSGLPGIARDLRTVAALMQDEDEGERLVQAARRLCNAFSDLLSAAEPQPTVPRQQLISAASRVGDATQALLYTVNSSSSTSTTGGELTPEQVQARSLKLQLLEFEREQADYLLSLAKSVANTAAALVIKAKKVAELCAQDDALNNLVIYSATQGALATSQMVATAKIVAPTIQDQSCQRQLLESCREVERAVQGIESACMRALRSDHDELRCELDDSIRRVYAALDELEQQVRASLANRHKWLQQHSTTTTSTTTTTTTTTQQQQQHRIDLEREDDLDDLDTTRLCFSQSDADEADEGARSELVQQARTLARATTKLIQDIRPDLEEQQQQQQQQQQHFTSPSSSSQIQRSVAAEAPPSSHHQNLHNNNTQNHHNHHHTTTISTTLYDEDEQDQQRRTGHLEQQANNSSSSGRPVSVYDMAEREEQEIRITRTSQSSNLNAEPTSSAAAQQQDDELPEATISGILGDLETTIMFATAGTLRAHDQHDSYLYHREQVLRCAKALVEDTRPLVASAGSGQRQLAQAAQESVLTMAKLADTVKGCAASLGPNNADSQVALIKSVKEVTESLADLIGSTKAAYNCEPNDHRLHQVKDSAKGMVGSVTGLLRTVKSIEDEQQRGIRAIEAALEAIEQELAGYEAACSSRTASDPASSQQVNNSATKSAPAADELTRISRPVTMATTKTVHAASSGLQDDAIVAANMGRKAIVDLLASTCACGQQAESSELRARIHEAGRNCALNYKHLLELLHRIFQHPSVASANPDFKQELISQSKIIASCVLELESCNQQQQSLVISNRKVPGIAQEISACEQILRKEKELEVAKTQLIAIRKAKYSNRPDDYQGYGGSLE